MKKLIVNGDDYGLNEHNSKAIAQAFLTSAGGIVTTIARLAKKIIIEHNTFHNPNSRYLHDTWEPREVWEDREVMDIHSPYDRIGKDYVSIDPKKIVGVIESCIPEEARAFKEPDGEIIAFLSNFYPFKVEWEPREMPC